MQSQAVSQALELSGRWWVWGGTVTLSLLPSRSLRTQSCPIYFLSITAPFSHSCASPALWCHCKWRLFMVLANDIELWEENQCWIKFLERWHLVLGSEYIIFHGLSRIVESTSEADCLDTQTCSLPGPPRPSPPQQSLEFSHWEPPKSP